MAKVNPIPAGYKAIIPYLVTRNAAAAIEFYKTVFDAVERMRMGGPDGMIGHAELQFRDSTLMLSDEFPGADNHAPGWYGGTPVSLMLYVEDVDATYHRALKQGAKSLSRPADMFWGDRFARIQDPFGHIWSLASHLEDVSPEEMERRRKAAFGA